MRKLMRRSARPTAFLEKLSWQNENLVKAYGLRERTSQHQRFYIDGAYVWIVTGNLEKGIQTFTEWTTVYPKDPNGHVRLSAASMEVGRYEAAAAEAGESLRLMPTAAAYTDLMSSIST